MNRLAWPRQGVEAKQAGVKSSEEIMEILEAFDLTGGLRAVAPLAGCDHKTIAHYVALRNAGKRLRRAMAIDPFLDKVEEWVDLSGGGSARMWCTRS